MARLNYEGNSICSSLLDVHRESCLKSNLGLGFHDCYNKVYY